MGSHIQTYGGGDLRVDRFTYSDFQSDVDDKKSTSRFIFVMNGGTVSWKCSKHEITTNSITEAEYMAACDATKEAVWMRKFIFELRVVSSIELLIPLYYYNNEAIAQANEPKSHQKSKHNEHRFYLIREIVACENVQL